jgi:hypothetical protein
MIATTITPEKSSLQRDAALEALLVGDLLDLLENPDGADVNQWLVAILDALLRILPREFRSEEAEGYLAVVLEEYPSWDRQVQQLREQHSLLFCELKELRNEADGHKRRNQIPLRCRRRVIEWVGLLTEHNRQESEMLQIAVNLEVGVGD